MTRIVDSIAALIGATPMLRLPTPTGAAPGVELLAKLEFLNPGGSIKDRPILQMLDAAERRGELVGGTTLIEASSGNTGIALAMLGAARGYPVIVVMPEDMSIERRRLMAAYGARVELTPMHEGMRGAVERAREIAALIEKRDGIRPFLTRQFDNPDNPAAHEATTAAEILSACQGRVDILVAGVGTGGTVSGCGRALKAHLPDLRVVAVEPAKAAAFRGDPFRPHAIQGIGAGFVPSIVDRAVLDAVEIVDDDDAIARARALATGHGLLIEPSSGANVVVAEREALRAPQGARIVTFLCDAGERYLA